MRFGERVKKLRLERNLSLEQLANKVSVTRATVSKWESGKEYPTAEDVGKLAKLFRVKANELITQEDDIKMQHVLDSCVSKKYYMLTLLFLGLTVVSAGMTKVAFELVFKILTVVFFIGYVVFSIYSKPKFEREEKARSNKTADLISKMAVIGILVLVVYCVFMM